MERIAAIEGLRAWLAWTVVLYHVVQVTGLTRTTLAGHLLSIAAADAVRIFIIISGFVIAGLVLTRREAWWRYITRRAFRIFPAYLIALAVGAGSMYLARDAVAALAWGDATYFTYDDFIRDSIQSVEAAPWAHAMLHLTLLQGVVSDDVIPLSQTSMLGPAWSLSLEWQFYLIAPAFIWMLLQPRWRLLAVGLVVAGAVADRFELFGHYILPSALPASGHFFLVGIASRLAFDRLQNTPALPLALILGLVGLGLLFRATLPLFAWAAFIVFLISESRWRDGLARWTGVAGRALLSSAPARALGSRSYAVYIVHWPIVQTMLYLLLPLGSFSPGETLCLLLVAVIPATFVASDLMYRFVERPMIRLGARLASAGAKTSGVGLDQAIQAKTP
jgi:peptidoglycan/LPS O-acetylase OafA/YrhL